MRRTALAATCLLVALPAGPATAADRYISGDGSTLTMDRVVSADGSIQVDGTIRVGSWSLSDWRPQTGLDLPGYYTGHAIRGITIDDIPVGDGDIEAGVLLQLALIDRVHPVLPPVAFSWPISVDGGQDGRWLGAGATGTSAEVPDPLQGLGGWAGICTSTLEPCEDIEIGGAFGGSVWWWLSHDDLGAGPGSTIEVGQANGGVVASFAWPAAPTMGGVNALSTAEVPGFRLQGDIRLGIAPTGTPEDQVDYTVRADLDPDDTLGTRPWSAQLVAPTLPGAYQIHAQTCWGLLEEPDCHHQVTALTL